MKKQYVLWLAIFLIFTAGPVKAENEDMKSDKAVPTGQSPKQFEKTVTKTIGCKYLLFLPEEYGKSDKKWPLILFLHGAGERGSNLDVVKKHGPPKIVETKKDFGFIVVSPQCPKDDWWPDKVDVLMGLLDEIVKKYNVDEERVYLTGLSMGGYGTWTLGCAHPERFAAIVPICGGGRRFFAGRLKDTPVWAFHGAKDRTVNPDESEVMVKAVNGTGGNAKLTVYPDAYHDSWTRTYENPELYEWLLKHRKVQEKK